MGTRWRCAAVRAFRAARALTCNYAVTRDDPSFTAAAAGLQKQCVCIDIRTRDKAGRPSFGDRTPSWRVVCLSEHLSPPPPPAAAFTERTVTQSFTALGRHEAGRASICIAG